MLVNARTASAAELDRGPDAMAVLAGLTLLGDTFFDATVAKVLLTNTYENQDTEFSF